MKKLIKNDQIIKLNQLENLKIDLKIYNNKNELCSNKVIPLKNLANLISSSR